MAEALRHSSFVNELRQPGIRDNERLEFLGDAVLNLTVGHILMERFPNLTEGELSRTRANLVNESRLAGIAQRLGMGSHLRLGKGEIQTDGHKKKSILADTLEAIIAAVYLDGGFTSAFKLVQRLFSEQFEGDGTLCTQHDHKSSLQEKMQAAAGVTPTYSVRGESGPDHDKTFRVRLTAGELTAEGQGKSKKAAEQDAARKALVATGSEDETPV